MLLCLFTLPAPLVCSGPEHFFSVMLFCPKRSCQVTLPVDAIRVPK